MKNELLEQQLKTKPNRKARAVKQSVATGTQYAVELRKMIRAIRADVNEHLVPAVKRLQSQYQQDGAPLAPVATVDAYLDELVRIIGFLTTKWTSPFVKSLADQVARRFVTTAADINRRRFTETMKSFGINAFGDSPALDEYLSAAAYDNARLIKTIPEQYLSQVESIVMTNVRAGNRSSAIIPSLTKQFGITERRAKMIARDQTAKLNGDMAKKRQQNAGFEYFQWLDVDDERVRDRHSELAERVTAYGKGIYRWDNPPLSDAGLPIIPGQDYQCRCNARPVSADEVAENQRAGRTNPSVKR